MRPFTVLGLAVLVTAPASASAAPRLVPVAKGLDAPVHVAAPPGDARLFIVDATDRPGEMAKPAGERNLLTAAEAGQWAAEAKAETLLLTHFWPGNDTAAAVERAREGFEGEVLAAEPGMVMDLS